jgi:hypothetical protein
MKTCTFRNSKPRDIFEGLFCINNPPSTQYSMKQCRDQSCRFCYERLDLTKRVEPAMNFSKNQIHCFVNHYQVYLNCDVVSLIFLFSFSIILINYKDMYNIGYYLCSYMSLS